MQGLGQEKQDSRLPAAGQLPRGFSWMRPGPRLMAKRGPSQSQRQGAFFSQAECWMHEQLLFWYRSSHVAGRVQQEGQRDSP